MNNSLLVPYPAVLHGYDEMFEAGGQARAHWAPLLDHLGAEGPEAMRQRVESVERQVHENGVTYNIYADPKGMQRPWEIDVLPFILPADEWAAIEAAVRQRATLLNRILIDIYGDQTVLGEGLLPPALVHGHAGFLRPCHGIQQIDDVALHMIAVDLARSPDGRWWVVTDRTQAPSGAGYALENRSVISRAFPDLLRELKVQPITGYFDTLRDSLTHWGRQCAARHRARSRTSNASANDALPLIVLLTPGQFNETYYEQTYLARHLGFPLVEGSDLTVRNGIVWLKTLSGPQRVDVILRRVDDDFCDPLELRSDSALGVVGLTDAARRGNVVIANGLGSNLLESGALLGYLPALCRRFLGESLLMPSVATWWCGEPAALEEVIEELDHLIIKPAFPQLRQAPVFGQDLDAGQRADFIAKLRARPQNYVAQELVRVSQAPVWRHRGQSDAGIAASAVGLRVFACATPTGYVVMPGALTRVATGPDSRVIAMQRGGASKDTWIQAVHQPPAQPVLPRSITADNLIRGDTRLASRIVEDLFWYGRYCERCDDITRLLRTALEFLLHTTPDARGSEWPTVQAFCAWAGLIELDDDDEESTPSGAVRVPVEPTVPDDLLVEHGLLDAVIAIDGHGLVGNLQRVYRVASHLRERLSVDNWHTLNRLAQRHPGLAQRPTLAAAITMLNDTLTSLMTLSGFALDGMTRDQGWRFMSVGRRLERMQFIGKALDHALAMPADGNLDWLLEITDSIVTYRARYMAQPEWLPVLDLLLLDESNPRSLVFQLNGLLQFLPRLSSEDGAGDGTARLASLHAQLLRLDPQQHFLPGSTVLIQLLRDLGSAGAAVSEQLGQRFFSYTGDVNHASFTP
ncbi:MAG: circularly permuted type 2 ATP-grasp protein [Herminiimonas sp.]|nr:circularly permuted type 2 ATP-grasp protein [Herminiimonas sp.]